MAVVDGGDVFDRALGRSEAELAAVLRARIGLSTARWVQVGCGVVAVGAVVLAVAAWAGADRPASGSGSRTVVVTLVAVAICVSVGLAAQAAFVVPLRRQVAMRERTMLGEVDPLRELFVHIAQREGWDDERIRATRRRLSQFPIEGEAFR
nr:hypothetical protein [Micromonospora sp. DSM 115978]